MRIEGKRQSSNVEDRRGLGGGGRRRGGRATIGIGGLVIILGVIAYGAATGTDVSGILDVLAGGDGGGSSAPPSAGEDEAAHFVSVILADTEDTWGPIFAQRGQRYEPPHLVLFRDSVSSACGLQSAAVGPFYCPGDHNAYVDLSFFDELARRYGAPGDFAQAYVLAHEIGHHVQNLTGVMSRVAQMERGQSEEGRNAISVRQELQADCYAGVWAYYAHHERQMLEPGDLNEGLTAAAAIGDDTLQRRANGRVMPESFTHGTSEQRVSWFRRGFESGQMDRCDTFSGAL
ncbi:MAG: neutral zinc metallopeptidase [Sandaracinaceae bacterium]